jgi:endoglucanase
MEVISMKKYLKNGIIVFSIALSACATAVIANAATQKNGDINNDGIVNAQDAGNFSDYLLGKSSYISGDADVNADNSLDVFDLCAIRHNYLKNTSTITDYGTPMNKNATAVADFTAGETPLFFASDGWSNGSCFDCVWRATQTSFKDNALNLTLDKDPKGEYKYAGAEYRTKDFYGYGHYETSMQAIKNDGIVSSFFTYTGESDNNPWDEIDIEILGKDTTKVQFNYYTNGVGKHEYMYDLGFDASKGYHTYGFDWKQDHITWYVDGKAVYTAYNNIPSTPGKIMMNVWNGTGVDDWLKPYNGNTPLTARYQWVTYNKQ